MLAVLAALAVALVPGERLDYGLRYGPVSIGRLRLETLQPETLGTEECWHFRADLELTRSFSWVFWANYRLETWCRTSDMVTLRSYKRTREPRYRAEWTADYDLVQSVANYSDGRTTSVESGARDLLSTWYYFRTLSLAAGDTVRTALHVDRRNYQLVAVARAAKAVSTPAGAFDCIAVVPNAGGPLGTVYLTDDSERIPVSIRTRVGGLVVSAFLRSVSFEEE
ncbi:DUF3108 domain-containing protein [candidate division WOR-3 bacterium]|uniref:DUF3108 domain-containing protein n=1 Tax=candidate division WOR-3 bacterium TaxID=2052148 RepID=A0A937XAY7_UNCW3|nr:DUF3108 domain-containing protein [candidate division WOR-3 bacterium]